MQHATATRGVNACNVSRIRYVTHMTNQEWELEDFHLAIQTGEGEILLDTTRELALMVYPWDACTDCKRHAHDVVESMGFTDILEVGHMDGYRIEGATTLDCDFFLIAPPAPQPKRKAMDRE